jgi:RNA polymerase sigma-70 factor, ECF subfamily
MRAAMTEPQRSVSQLKEGALVDRVAHGDEQAVRLLYETYADRVFRFVYRRVSECYEDAEEVTQDAFVTAASCAATFDGSCTVLTWLCGIAKVRIADHYRRQGRRKRVPPGQLARFEDDAPAAGGDRGALSLENLPDRLDMDRLVVRLMASLRDDEREVLLLRYVEEFSIREMAVLMNRSEKAVESLLMRAKKKAARAALRWL